MIRADRTGWQLFGELARRGTDDRYPPDCEPITSSKLWHREALATVEEGSSVVEPKQPEYGSQQLRAPTKGRAAPKSLLG